MRNFVLLEVATITETRCVVGMNFIIYIMKVKGFDNQNYSVTSQGQGTFNSVGAGLGIASFFGIDANNILGGCGRNGRNGGVYDNGCGYPAQPVQPVMPIEMPSFETREAALLREQVATLRAENFSRQSSTTAFEKSAEYTKGLHDEQAVSIKELFNQAIVQGVAIQRAEDKAESNFNLLKGEIATQVALLRGEMNTTAALAAKDREAISKDIQIEAERRACADNSIVNYTNQTFYVKQVSDVETSNDTTAQTTYNPIPCYTPRFCI